MNLRDYLAKHDLTQIQFGKLMTPTVSQARVSHWLNGRLRVSLADALQIQEVTNGEVTVNDWSNRNDRPLVDHSEHRSGIEDRRSPPCGGQRDAKQRRAA